MSEREEILELERRREEVLSRRRSGVEHGTASDGFAGAEADRQEVEHVEV